MSVAPSQAYLRTKVLTASPAELRLLLLDGALRFAETAKRGYEERNFDLSYEGTSKCQAILTELMCSLRPERDPDLCNKLAALYTYMYKRLIEASIERSTAIVEEVIGLLQYDRATWVLFMADLAKTGGVSCGPQSTGTTDALPGADATTGTAAPKQRISLTG
ncbi:MAG: flagellar export chaperone FliS [Phycisphaerae bacterium]|nr:flagellar export chaperone FliS [Phycisphaerae bacterium]